MRRRDFITVLGGTGVLLAIGGGAEELDGKGRVGVLVAFNESDVRPQAWLTTFTKGLADLGWTTPLNLQIDIRWAGNDVNLMKKYANELVALKPNVILTFGTPVTAALQQ